MNLLRVRRSRSVQTHLLGGCWALAEMPSSPNTETARIKQNLNMGRITFPFRGNAQRAAPIQYSRWNDSNNSTGRYFGDNSLTVATRVIKSTTTVESSGCERIMSRAFLDDDLDLAAKFLYRFSTSSVLSLNHRVEAASTHGEVARWLWPVGPGYRGAAFLQEHCACADSPPRRRAGNLVRILDGPLVHLAGPAARAFDGRLLRKAVAHQVFVGGGPVLHQRTIGVGLHRAVTT